MAGTYYVHVLVTDKVGNKNEIVSSSVVVDSVLNYAYTGLITKCRILPGKHKLEVRHKEDTVLHSYGGKRWLFCWNHCINRKYKILHFMLAVLKHRRNFWRI